MKRVVFYARVSTEHEEQLSALDNQIEWYRDLIKKNRDWVLVDQYIDEGITGTSDKKRKEFQRMIADGLEHKKFDLIITREVSRFARNTVDTLNCVRKLKAVGIGVYFVSDNINTFDDAGDGELRLTIMASLAQEESRKISNRVRAGLKIARDKKMILGSGNILGYDRVGRNEFVINPEQADTVRMISKWYLEGNGMKRIKNLLEQNHRLTAEGKEQWQVSTICRVVNNPIYAGYQYQQQSSSSGYLTQNRVKNRKEDYILVKVDVEPIYSLEVFQQMQRVKDGRLTHDMNNIPRGKRDTDDIWLNKLICVCGSRHRRYKWHEKDYGYSCYNQALNGKTSFREKEGLPLEGSCDLVSCAGWKLDMMMWKVIKRTWTTGEADIKRAFEIVKECYQSEKDDNASILNGLNAKKEKIKKRKDTLIEMRADGEISKEDFAKRKLECDKQLEQIESRVAELKVKEDIAENMDDNLLKIRGALAQMIDFSTGVIDHELLDGLVNKIVHIGNYEYDVYLNLCDTHNIDDMLDAENEIKVKKAFIDGGEILKEKHMHLFDLSIDFEEAKAYRKMSSRRIRECQWEDMQVHVYL